MYVVVLFLLIWSLFQVFILCEAKCEVSSPDPSILYILETNAPSHKNINDEFIMSMKSFKHDKDYPSLRRKILKNCPTNLLKTMEATKNLIYVINLYVEDFYQTNYNDVKKYNLRWVGDIGNGTLVNVCRSDTETKNGDMETCKLSTELRKHAKLASDKVLEIPFLFDIVIDFPKKTPNVIHHEIAICAEKYIDWSDFDVTHIFYDVVKVISFLGIKSKVCNPNFSTIPPFNVSDNVIAVVAPNPEWITETNKPVIFYEEPYFRPEATAFYKNSIMRTRSSNEMAVIFLRFMWKMNWNRVAIVSDDSVKSEEFERELRLLFSENGVIHTVKTGGEMRKCCNFNEALVSLEKADARIIIANVDQQHASLLAQQAKYHGLNYQNHVWIARDWSEETAKKAAKKLNRVFSVSPTRTSIEMYIQAVKDVVDDNKNNKYYDFFNQTQFARDIRRSLKPMDTTQFTITMTSRYGYHKLIGSYENRVQIFYDPVPNIPTDSNIECTFKSTNYDKPCGDLDFIFFMLVVAIFSVTVLGITYFFETPDTPYNRMVN